MTAVQIVEVSLRDGLQNESVMLSTADKIRLAGQLADAGAQRIEAVSFVHPKWVPAMADAEAVMAGIDRIDGVSYSGLVVNRRGLDRALAAEMDEINVVVCASDTFSRRNQNMSTQDAVREAVEVVATAREAGVFTTLTVATAFGCPFEGEVPPDAVINVVGAAHAAGADEVCLADTIGVGVPSQVADLYMRSKQVMGEVPLRFHFHDTRHTGIANAHEAVRVGASALDASVGGIGGCPFAPRATGNIATEDLIYLLDRSGISQTMRIEPTIAIADELEQLLGEVLPSALQKAGGFPPRAS
ncbi:hydroxymethylglutaryl-CoA lyase [Aeromicrobium panaciterrae]|uniref:hydroxymethylglutaryl-CoA lyase n=1 Tax=Aeromicrobium panaciterrae TaxID=363861 RepID=UPI0031DC43B6